MTNDNYPNYLSIQRIFVLVFVMITIPLVLDQLVFRGVYLSFLEPQSTAGMTLLARSIQKAHYVPGKKNVLILGNSRISEGFSARIANEIGAPQGFNFIGLGLPGTSPRVWYYVLRDLVSQRNSYDGIFLQATTLRDDDAFGDNANQTIDTAYLAPLLNWGDIFSYPQSFTDPKATLNAVYALAFPGASFKNDVLEFIKAPTKRMINSSKWREQYPSWYAAYKGHGESLPSAETPFSTDHVLAKMNGANRRSLEIYFKKYIESKPQPMERVFAYQYKWFGQIAQQYASKAVTVGVFLIPRGPYHAALNKPAEAEGALKLLERKGMISLVDTAVSLPLEKPEFFFDTLHMNATGRAEFSRNLAKAIIAQLKD
ncbi:MAG: hypothetical protein PHO08_10060 [Methylococcales bacterium]|nr:hypothetical protein [Methylococcales bacterium]MDD5630677.1 hypothetical protein [Methylococcales bacterium]